MEIDIRDTGEKVTGIRIANDRLITDNGYGAIRIQCEIGVDSMNFCFSEIDDLITGLQKAKELWA